MMKVKSYRRTEMTGIPSEAYNPMFFDKKTHIMKISIILSLPVNMDPNIKYQSVYL